MIPLEDHVAAAINTVASGSSGSTTAAAGAGKPALLLQNALHWLPDLSCQQLGLGLWMHGEW